jgi:hypothetical protein
VLENGRDSREEYGVSNVRSSKRVTEPKLSRLSHAHQIPGVESS